MADKKMYKVGITVKEPWSADISYEVLDITLYAVENGGDGCSYIAIRANQGVTPGTDDTVWVKATQRGQSIYDLAVKYGDFEGTEAEFEAEYEAALHAAQSAAQSASEIEAQVETNEAARVTAERARSDAETARSSAETARINAENARNDAESLRDTAESDRVRAEAGRVTAEASRVEAETFRQGAEQSRRQQFEGLKTDMETAIENVDAKSAEIAEDIEGYEANEAARVSAENARATAESARVSAESSRVSAESARATAETERQTAEGNRATAETERASAEGARTTAEQGRVSAESGRVSAESERVAAETAREFASATAVQNAETATQAANTAAEHAEEAAATIDEKIAGKADKSEVSQLGQEVDGTVVEGYYVDNLGQPVQMDGFCYAKVPVTGGTTIRYISGTKFVAAYISVWNASNIRIGSYNGATEPRDIALDANASYVIASFVLTEDAGIKVGDDYIFRAIRGVKNVANDTVKLANDFGFPVLVGKAYSTTGNAVIDKTGWMLIERIPLKLGDVLVYNGGKAESPCGIGIFNPADMRMNYKLASTTDWSVTISDGTSYAIASFCIGTSFKLTVNGVSVFGEKERVALNTAEIKEIQANETKTRGAIGYSFGDTLVPSNAVVIGSLGIGDTLDLTNKSSSSVWWGRVLECEPGDVFTINAWGGSTIAPYVFIDASNTILAFETGYLNKTVVAPANTDRIVCSANVPNDSTVHTFVLEYGINKRVDELEEKIDGSFDTVPVSPVYVRKEEKDGTAFNENVKLYPEGFMTEMGQHLMLNNSREWSPISLMMNASHREKTQTLSVVVNHGGKSKTVSVPVRRVNQKLVTEKTAFLLCIGESTTEGSIDDPTLYDGTKHYNKFWGYPSALQYFAILDEAKHGNGNNIKTIGHKSNRGLSFEFEGQTYVNRSFCCGYGGHATYWLLNYPLQMQTTQSATIISGKDLWYFLGLATKTPYNQESYNAEITEWANDATHWALMTQTPAGKYKVDGCAELWNKIRDHASTVCGGTTIPSTTISGTYTGSSAQLASLNAWAEEVFANPENPFFDITVARDGVTGCAFSLAKYLERYRTMDDAGNRLSGSAGQTVVGGDGNTYTIGTKVTDTSAWDVCTPTHIIFNIGINDNINNSVANTVANVKQLVGRVSVPVGYFVCRYGGVANSGQWFDVGTVEEVSLSSYNAQMVSELTAWFADNEANGKYLLPIWQTMYPASSDTWCKETDVMGNDRFFYETAIHTGYFGYKSIGLECLSWLYYLITSATQF